MNRYWEINLYILKAIKSLRIDNWNNKEIAFLLSRMQYPEFYGEKGMVIFEEEWASKFKEIGVSV